jgi:Zn ribbon nucleic-acid-binding protein
MVDVPLLPIGRCPVCDAADAYVDQRLDKDEYFVECVNCGVYHASRKAFRHFEYLRWRADSAGLERLDQLASALRARPEAAQVRLEYDTWHELLKPQRES